VRPQSINRIFIYITPIEKYYFVEQSLRLLKVLLRLWYGCGFSQHFYTLRQMSSQPFQQFAANCWKGWLDYPYKFHKPTCISFANLPTVLCTCSSVTEDVRTISYALLPCLGKLPTTCMYMIWYMICTWKPAGNCTKTHLSIGACSCIE